MRKIIIHYLGGGQLFEEAIIRIGTTIRVNTVYYKGGVQVGCETGVIFFSDKIKISLSEVDHIYFDGTFLRYHPSFINRGLFSLALDTVLPVIHCLLTSKHDEIFTAVLARIHELVPQLKPIHGMSYWEKEARNLVKREFQGIHLR